MTVKSISLLPLVAILLLAVAPARAADQGTVQAVIPWEGEGRIFQIDSRRIQFLGAIEGIMYVENAQGEMNEAFVQCPIIQMMDLETGTTEALGHCEITASPDDVVYAQLSCKGRVGDCVGRFVLIDGEGKFAGISGEGKLRVRSPIHALAGDLGSGALLRVAAGLAVIRDLKFSTP
ncbi:MAG: hypothetical protein LJE92_15920 [Gammaproteobacteria bacterium]|jgi:hypothetical protein|nr:hypothetical protein [Gammaproteobacteria bacterium]